MMGSFEERVARIDGPGVLFSVASSFFSSSTLTRRSAAPDVFLVRLTELAAVPVGILDAMTLRSRARPRCSGAHASGEARFARWVGAREVVRASHDSPSFLEAI